MADAFTYKAVGQKFGSGNEYANLTVVNFAMPDGTKACAYSCGMNIDLDGEPQAYGPISKPAPRPLDALGNAGWLSQDKNTAKKAEYELAQKNLNDLEKQKLVLPANTPDAVKKALDTKIEAARKAVKRINPYDATAKNYGKIFWHWYGLKALTPAEARQMTHHEKMDISLIWITAEVSIEVRHPVLDTTPIYEDVNGRFPVVQSKYEPGPGYFVSVLPQRLNPAFPIWDQRAFVPAGQTGPLIYGAITNPLTRGTGVKLKDNMLAIRLDTEALSFFPFLDSGAEKVKVGECSVGAFKSLGGETGGLDKYGRPSYKNNFQVLYLGFPDSASDKTPAAKLASFAKASNASDFPMILAFISKATADAKKGTNGPATVNGKPLTEYENWKSGKSKSIPSSFDGISRCLNAAGFNPAVTP